MRINPGMLDYEKIRHGELLLNAALSIMRALRDFDDSVFKYALNILMLDELPK